MGKHGIEARKKYRHRKRDEKREKRKQMKIANTKNHICLCTASSCPDNTTLYSSSQPTSPTPSGTTSTAENTLKNKSLITFTSDPLYIRFMEYTMLKKRVAAIEERESHSWYKYQSFI